MTEFSDILESAFEQIAAEHGLSYNEGGAKAWGQAGTAYISFALGLLPSSVVRNLQYTARETAGPILLDCKWYDRLAELCFDANQEIKACLPSTQGNAIQCISRQLFIEMLDFCREG